MRDGGPVKDYDRGGHYQRDPSGRPGKNRPLLGSVLLLGGLACLAVSVIGASSHSSVWDFIEHHESEPPSQFWEMVLFGIAGLAMGAAGLWLLGVIRLARRSKDDGAAAGPEPPQPAGVPADPPVDQQADDDGNKCPFCNATLEEDPGPVCRQCGFDLEMEWTPPPGEEEVRFDSTRRACSGCGALNPITADFCSECNAPVGDYASAKPFERILSTGYVLRRTVEGVPMSSPLAKAGRIFIGVFYLIQAAILFSFPLAGILMRGSIRNLFGPGSPLAEWHALLLAACMAIGALMGYAGLRIIRSPPAKPEQTAPPRDLRGPEPSEGAADQEEPPPDWANARTLVLATVLVALAILGLALVSMIFG